MQGAISEALLEKELHGLLEMKTKEPHHGVIVPLGDGTWAMTQKGDDALPDTIEVVDDKGAVTSTVECADLHGETVVNNTLAFGCSDSIVIIRDGKPTVVANPDASGERVGAMVADKKGEIFVGDWAADFQVTAPWVKGRSAALTWPATPARRR
ncbi:MAG TPA: hypothetical protein K8V15_01515 [Tessaracoccus flavescens]|uniref:Uncharacterized protein n=1 Tax=Tessaracoccus flavescens TaxID=399497 RepID=A0A921EM21_9ACTN|nr:hypothetical protein [Tessaracoccus flavescens]